MKQIELSKNGCSVKGDTVQEMKKMLVGDLMTERERKGKIYPKGNYKQLSQRPAGDSSLQTDRAEKGTCVHPLFGVDECPKPAHQGISAPGFLAGDGRALELQSPSFLNLSSD